MSQITSQSSLCKELMTRLSEYIDGELEENLCREIEKHLAGCENCRILVSTSRKTVELYHRHYRRVQINLPTDTSNRLWQALRNAGCVSK